MHLGNMPSNDMPYPENEENFPLDHSRNEDMGHDSWRTYNDHASDIDMPPNNEMHSENGSYHHNPELRHGFEPHNSIGPPSRGRSDRYPPAPMRGEEDFIPDNIPPRGGSHYGDDMYQSGDMDRRNNHMGPGHGSEDMGYMSHKRSWNDGPNRDDPYPSMDFDGPPPPSYNQRQHVRQFHGSRGPRAPYRGMRSSPYRVVNRGRGMRGGYPN